MLVQQVDHLDPQPLQRAFDGASYAFGATVEPVGIKVVAELGGDDDVPPERLQRLAHQFLVRERAVDLGGVEEGDAALYGHPDERDHLGAVRGRTPMVVEAHAAQADGRDGKIAKLARLHTKSPCLKVTPAARARFAPGPIDAAK
jgi:hypothetical protein